MINEIVPQDKLMEKAKELALSFAKGPTKAYGAVKQLLTNVNSESLETQMELEARTIAAMSVTADGNEGINAFLNRRKPEFKGK